MTNIKKMSFPTDKDTNCWELSSALGISPEEAARMMDSWLFVTYDDGHEFRRVPARRRDIMARLDAYRRRPR